MKRNRIVFTAAGIILFLVLITGCAGHKKQWGYQALKINGQFVDVSVFSEEYARYYENNSKNSRVMRMTEDERGSEILDNVIEREIVENYITNRKDIAVTDQEVSDFLDRYIKPALYINLEGDEPIPLSYRDITVSRKIYSTIRPYLLRLKIMPELAAKYNIKAVPKEVREEYQQQLRNNYLVIGRHIVLPAGQMKLAGELAEKMKNELDAGDLVRKYSIDADAKDKGGVMGNIALAPITPGFIQKMRNVRPGEIIKPFQVSYGIEIIRIEDVLQFNHPEDEIEKNILIKYFHSSPAFQDWLNTLKAGIKIEVIDPALKAFYLYKTGEFAEAAPLFIKLYQSGKERDKLEIALACFKKTGNGNEVVRWSREGLKAFPAFRLNYLLAQAAGFMMLQKTNECIMAMKNAEKAAGGELLKEIADRYFELGLTNEGRAYTNGK